MSTYSTPAGERRTESPLRPNMLASNMRAISSTFDNIDFSHSIFRTPLFASSVFLNGNLVGAAFQGGSLEGANFQRCSLRGAQIQNCDVEGLVVNGIKIGELLKLATFARGAE